MPALFVFLLKVNIALLLFCAGYYLVLRRLTFYTLNRIYLVTAIVFASIYPKINLSDFAQRHQQIAKPVQAIVFNWQAPARALAKPFEKPNYWHWAEIVFWAGALLLAVRLAVQLYSLYRIYRNSTAARIFNHDVRVIKGNSGPFSFWNSIYVNPSRHEQADLKAILQHEQVHVNEWHTLDILLAELSTIFYWFNPGIWLMKKAIRENIEFITDQKILKKGTDSKQYQYSLVSVSFASSSNTIVNHFNISTIKKRIIMMNAKRSSKVTLTRYAFLVPAVIALLLIFSISKAALIKDKNAYIALAVGMNNAGTHIKTGRTAKPPVSTNSKTVTANLLFKTAPYKTIDTIRKGDTFISTAASSDSLTYVINGKKVTKAAFKALDPDQIYSIEIVSGEEAAKIIDNVDSNHEVLFVTTDDSEAGKRFKEKLDKLNGNGYINDASSMSVYSYGQNGASGNGYSSGAVTVNGTLKMDSNFSTMRYNVKPLKLHKFKALPKGTYTIMADSLYTNDAPIAMGEGADSVSVYELHSDKSKGKLYTYKIRPQAWAKSKSMPNRTFVYSPKPTTATGWSFNNETSIEHLSSKIIIIDGKKATESDMKKLSAADIESMSVKSGDDITRKYGSKARDGVVFIETKKK